MKRDKQKASLCWDALMVNWQANPVVRDRLGHLGSVKRRYSNRVAINKFTT